MNRKKIMSVFLALAVIAGIGIVYGAGEQDNAPKNINRWEYIKESFIR